MHPLPAVPAELEVLARHFPPGDLHQQLTESQATLAAAKKASVACTWIHLACHASEEQADPASSGFALWDGKLTIADLLGQPTQYRDLAFLSACQTAAASTRHPDEAIHLAAAMQFLGYRHVIATMWTITDSLAPQVAEAVYSTLTRSGRGNPDGAASALHQAIQHMRQAEPTNPFLWAPYMHLGG
jgi:CHAT domain-containing protein